MKSLDRFVESDDVHVQYQANGTLKAWIANNPQLFSFFMPSDQISSDFNGCKFVSDGPQSTTVVRFNVVAEDNSGSCGVRMLFVRPIALIVPMSDYPPQLPRAVNIALRPKDHRKQSIPYSLKVEVKPTMGQFLWFQGKIVSKGSTLVLRFIKGGPEYGVGTESVLLSIEARFEDGHLLLGSLTKWGGKWNDEEFADGCISKFQTDFDMSIRFGERDFEFYCRNELMAYYPYEYTDIPFSEIDYVYANGDIEIYRMRFAGDVFMVPYKSSFNSPHMMTGQRLYIIGVESVRDFVDNYWMYVDFYSEKEIIFRFWVDRKTKKITLNGDHGGTKNLDSFPFNTAGYGDRLRGGGFYLDFLLETDLFRIFVNNQEIGTYEHKVDLNDKRISHFEISGTLIIRSIEIGSISDIDIPEHNES
ncbi:galactoside-binding lectin domain-containing protein [Ditylenchus destructor]|uniref:Galectin n=1 Tax=Ditylenchus destructor TaxID=166010 RepID=A0AAD4RD23_9BILA|nr:galactoside-binding lectin domain-containing protein [Ditylenchus destructor]